MSPKRQRKQISMATTESGIDFDALRKLLPTLDEAGKKRIGAQLDRLTKVKQAGKGPARTSRAPETDDELHAWIIRETGYDIPRVAVCVDHCAPFDFIADAYFERERAL